MKRLLIIIFSLFSFTFFAAAQEARISGTISDAFGPVMMCNVIEIDANNRNVSFAQTDLNGNFSLAIKNKKNKLRISYVGYQTVTLPIGRGVGGSTDVQHGRGGRSGLHIGRRGTARTDCRTRHRGQLG